MELNSIIFPAPSASYDAFTFPGELIWLPHLSSPDSFPIPCLFLQHLMGSSKVLIFFHGNAEDIGLAYQLCSQLRGHLKVHVLIVEYPGYGLYVGKPSEKSICADADSVIEYLTSRMEWRPSNILVFGRSIGSGPACYLASRSVVRNVAGRVAQFFVSQRFNNIDLMPLITCPTFFLHGLRDTLIPARESQELHAKCGGLSFIHMPPYMDHNEFEYIEDLVFPLSEFLKKCQVALGPVLGERSFLMFPEQLFDCPRGANIDESQGRMNRFLKKVNG